MSYVLTYKFESGENNFDGNSMHRCPDVIELEKTLSSFTRQRLDTAAKFELNNIEGSTDEQANVNPE